jgi:hypothetical protein
MGEKEIIPGVEIRDERRNKHGKNETATLAWCQVCFLALLVVLGEEP